MPVNLSSFEGPVCPVPIYHRDQIVMGHGSGGRMTADLIRDIFQPAFSNPSLDEGNDFASVSVPTFNTSNGRLIVSVDSHIVKPVFFPGGDIGRLAICGTVNDVAVSGAKPLYITAGFILEEGLPISTLQSIVQSMKSAADEAGVNVVAGDTKVVEKGGADQIFITTTGFGWLDSTIQIGGQYARPGDSILVSGTLGDHGIAVLSARGELGFETSVCSDTAPLNHLVDTILQASPHTHVLRDPTRGGVATTLNEIANQSHVGITLVEESIPLNPATRSACDMLGFDPLYVANEGKLIVIVPQEEAQIVLNSMKQTKYGKDSAIIGQITSNHPGQVLMQTPIGGTRLLDVLAGEMLPRIC
ncbi:hydrogenase expression/formation protein HypE [Leptolinea tardivitalis]|uniref:Hydrogenase n=1 Tax=Leptolinea tardivitalis TaxID=229920 RepID=A0A0P6XH62_9CHLR|nr:hydrogenase expression/formation protein HypE [Leptolinea tardivitalis]KPL74721.1 hydrogenase [Leptolinea tardivitalis]GAP22912.1 hydrogenase maturation protein, carbamoyl dehydratase HypE [Leptolinea tardivitalis]